METRLLIDGELVEGQGAELAVENPYTEDTLTLVGSASPKQIETAIVTAGNGFRSWSGTPAGERAEILHEFARKLRDNTEAIATTMTLEGGKPLVEHRDEVGWTAAAFDFYAELARSEAGRVIPPIEASQVALVVKEPVGIFGCIVPWNYPLLLLAWKIAPALAAGNAVICKPSELTPLATLQLGPLFSDFPPGAVSILAGAGEVGAALVEDERIGGIAFTGSVPTGKKIGEICSQRVAHVNLELGGKDPFIVLPDIAEEIDIAARGGVWAAFLNAGQVCTSAERFYVHEKVYDEFVANFIKHTEELQLGDPMQAGTEIGPLASSVQRQKVLDQVDKAVASGAEIVTGGGDSGQPHGHFIKPIVVTGAPQDSVLLNEETFGPVAPIVRVSSLDEAIKQANSTVFGLGANIYTRDLNSIVRCMREIKAGTVWFNDPLTDNDAGPFGGYKQSGFGRELGREGLEAFQETKHIHIETKIEAKEWWYPYN